MASSTTSTASGMPGFNVYDQPFTLLQPDGFTRWQSSTVEIAIIQNLATRTGIVFSSQLGASAMLLLVLLLMTEPGKRRSMAFVFNALALFFNAVRCAMMCAEVIGPLLNFVVLNTNDYSLPGGHQALKVSVTCTAITFLVYLLMEMALVIQVRVVCLAASRRQRLLVTLASAVVSLLAIGFRLNLTIINSMRTLHVETDGDRLQAAQDWAQRTSNIMAVCSIAFFSLIFCGKLAVAIHSRRALGLKQFGAMQIIFIMGCQTLIVPAIFAILDYYVLLGAQLGSFVETLVIIFLPLSSMWATASIKSKHYSPANRDVVRKHNAIPVGHGHSDFSEGTDKQHLVSGTTDTLVGHSVMSSSAHSSSPKEKRSTPRHERSDGVPLHNRDSFISDMETDVEMQKYGGRSIFVDRSYSVSSDNRYIGRAR